MCRRGATLGAEKCTFMVHCVVLAPDIGFIGTDWVQSAVGQADCSV
jgi:hypothetical protein